MFGVGKGQAYNRKFQVSRQGLEETVTGDYALVINGHSLVSDLFLDIFLSLPLQC